MALRRKSRPECLSPCSRAVAMVLVFPVPLAQKALLAPRDPKDHKAPKAPKARKGYREIPVPRVPLGLREILAPKDPKDHKESRDRLAREKANLFPVPKARLDLREKSVRLVPRVRLAHRVYRVIPVPMVPMDLLAHRAKPGLLVPRDRPAHRVSKVHPVPVRANPCLVPKDRLVRKVMLAPLAPKGRKDLRVR